MSKAKFDNKSRLIVDTVDFKRASTTLLDMLRERGNNLKRYELNEIHEMLSLAFGYADYHNLRQEAKGNQDGYNPMPDPFERFKSAHEADLNKNALWLKEACPSKLLERRSLTWCESALALTTFDYQMWRTYPMAPHLTLIVGKDSELVTKALSNACKGFSRLVNVGDSNSLQQLFSEVESKIKEIEVSRFSPPSNDGWLRSNHPNKMAPGQYYCIKGFDKTPLTKTVIEKLVEISDLDYGLDLAVSIKRSDLVRFTKPDMSQPHFHYLTILDLDKIQSGDNSNNDQSLYNVWVDPTTRANASSMMMGA